MCKQFRVATPFLLCHYYEAVLALDLSVLQKHWLWQAVNNERVMSFIFWEHSWIPSILSFTRDQWISWVVRSNCAWKSLTVLLFLLVLQSLRYLCDFSPHWGLVCDLKDEDHWSSLFYNTRFGEYCGWKGLCVFMSAC